MPLTPDYLRARRPLRDKPIPETDAATLEELGLGLVSAAIDAGIAALGVTETSSVALDARITLTQVAPTTTHPGCVRICFEVGGRTQCYHGHRL